MRVRSVFNYLDNLSFSSFRKMKFELSEVQKKVALVAAAIFSVAVIGWLLYRNYAKRNEEKNKLKPLGKVKPKPAKRVPSLKPQAAEPQPPKKDPLTQPPKKDPLPQPPKKDPLTKDPQQVEQNEANNPSPRDEAIQTLNDKITILPKGDLVGLLLKICPLGGTLEENKKGFALLNAEAVNHLLREITANGLVLGMITSKPNYAGLLSDEQLKKLDLSAISLRGKNSLLKYLFPPHDALLEENKARFALLSPETVKQFSESCNQSSYHLGLLSEPKKEPLPADESLPKQPEVDSNLEAEKAIQRLNDDLPTLDELTIAELLMKGCLPTSSDTKERQKLFALLKPETVNSLLKSFILTPVYLGMLSDEHLKNLDAAELLSKAAKMSFLMDTFPASEDPEETIRRIRLLKPETVLQFAECLSENPRLKKLFDDASTAKVI